MRRNLREDSGKISTYLHPNFLLPPHEIPPKSAYKSPSNYREDVNSPQAYLLPLKFSFRKQIY